MRTSTDRKHSRLRMRCHNSITRDGGCNHYRICEKCASRTACFERPIAQPSGGCHLSLIGPRSKCVSGVDKKATHLRCGGIFSDSVTTNFLLIPIVKDL